MLMKTFQLAIKKALMRDQIINNLLGEIDDLTEELSEDSFDEDKSLCDSDCEIYESQIQMIFDSNLNRIYSVQHTPDN